MTLKRRVDQGTGRRAVKRCLAMELNRKAGDPGLAANAQIQNLQHAIEFSQIVVDEMDRKVGRLLHWINPEQAGDVESSREAMRLQLIDLHPAPTLEVLGIEVSAERNLARGRRRGALMASTAATVRSSGEPVQSTLTFPSPAVSKPRSR